MRDLKNFAAIVGLVGLASCQEDARTLFDPEAPDEAPSEPAAATIRPIAGSERELFVPDAVGERAFLAFRAEAGGHRAGYLTHQATVVRGAIDVVPRHFDGARTVDGLPIQLATHAISRGGAALPAKVRSTAIQRGRLVLDRGAVVEQIDNREDGIEQSWRFAAEPAGQGDLVVEVAARGHAEVVAGASGLHFHNPGRLGVRYSNAVWIDATGASWDLPSRWTGERIAITVPADVIDASRFPAVLDPTVSPEVAVDSPTSGNSGEAAQEVSMTSSGSEFFAVWADNRNGTDADIFATRLQSDGTVTDTNGVAISTASGVQSTPTAAFINGRYVVAWVSGGDIKAAHSSPNSNMAVTQLAFPTNAAAEQLPDLASRGSEGLLVWQSGNDIRGARYSGTSFGAPFDIAATGAVEARPTVAADPGGGYLVAWTEGSANNDVKAQLVSAAGALTGGVITVSAAALIQTEPSAAFNGTDFVVVFTSGADIYGTRVSTAGVVLDTRVENMVTVGGVPVSTATGVQLRPSVACDSAACLVVWQDRRNIATNGFDLFGQRVSNTFTTLGAEISVSTATGAQVSPSVAAVASGYAAGWTDDRTGGVNLAMGARIASGGAVTDGSGILLNTSRNAQREATYGYSPAGSIAMWSDSRSAGNDVMGVRYNASGTKIDASALTISGASGGQETPSVTHVSGQFLAVWSDGRNATRDIYAARVQSDGTVSDPGGIEVTTAAGQQLVPDVASDGSSSLVVWQDRRNGGFDIFGAIVSSAGAVTVADIQISTASGDQNRPSVAWNAAAGVYVVVWSDQRDASDVEVFGTRVQPDGTVLDPAGVLVGSGPNSQLRAEVASSSSGLLAVWDDRRSSTEGDIYGTRLTATGGALSVLDPDGIAIATGAAGAGTPTAVGLLGGDFAVAWVDDRNAGTTGDDIFAARVTSGGAVQAEFVVSNVAGDESEPAYQTDTADKFTVYLVYQRLNTSLNVQRVLRRPMVFEGFEGQTCKQDSQCDSGFCVDGVCCDSACAGGTTDCQACSVARGAAVDGVCGVVAAGKLCRGLAGGSGGTDKFCDLKEFCDGVDVDCPDDIGRNEGEACTGLCGAGVCPADDVSGAPHFCDC